MSVYLMREDMGKACQDKWNEGTTEMWNTR